LASLQLGQGADMCICLQSNSGGNQYRRTSVQQAQWTSTGWNKTNQATDFLTKLLLRVMVKAFGEAIIL